MNLIFRRDALETEMQAVLANRQLPFLVHFLRCSSMMDTVPLQKATRMCPQIPVLLLAHSEGVVKARCCVPKVRPCLAWLSMCVDWMAGVRFLNGPLHIFLHHNMKNGYWDYDTCCWNVLLAWWALQWFNKGFEKAVKLGKTGCRSGSSHMKLYCMCMRYSSPVAYPKFWKEYWSCGNSVAAYVGII